MKERDRNGVEQVGIFKNSVFSREYGLRFRLLAFLLSVAIHALLFFLVIVTPLSKSITGPQDELIQDFFLPPLTPRVPPPPHRKHRGSSDHAQSASSRAWSAVTPTRFVVPFEIPQEINEEEISDVWTDGGVEGGIEGGIVGGKLGGIVGGVFEKDAEGPIRCLGEIKPPRLIKEVQPIWPKSFRNVRIEGGAIIIEAQTDIHGRVVRLKVLRSLPLLDKYVIDAVKQWIYEPMIINGKPRSVIFTVVWHIDVK